MRFCAADSVGWFHLAVVPQGYEVVKALVLWLQIELVEHHYYSGIRRAGDFDPIVNICRIGLGKIW